MHLDISSCQYLTKLPFLGGWMDILIEILTEGAGYGQLGQALRLDLVLGR